MGKSKVSYFYNEEIGHFYYGPGHPMKPHRMKMAHHLILSYGLYRKMEVYRPHPATKQEMQKFHSEEYVNFLQRITPDAGRGAHHAMQKFNLGEYTDCPVFDGIFEFCSISSGCSIDGALKLNHKLTDIAINWAGGLHHAKKGEASGFCYVNDIVLGILELLKYHPRVLYIDIDIHHGDGVEEAFYCTDRVMTCSFHKYGDFFPGTGNIKDIGAKAGRYYSVNVPLEDGMDDASYQHVFQPVISKIMEVYQPTAVVIQCGADSLCRDRLGSFNLTTKGHADCVGFVKSFALPMLVLGGGGYVPRNVARAWAYETAVLLDQPVGDDIPRNDFYDFYAPDYKLHLVPEQKENLNTREHLDNTKAQVLQHLMHIQGAPSVQLQEVPPDYAIREEDEDAQDPPDKRPVARNRAGGEKAVHEAEFYDRVD